MESPRTILDTSRGARADTPWVDTWTKVGEFKIYARMSPPVRTNGTTLVLVHGLGVSGRYLMPTADCLAADHAVVVPDLPGFGRSDKPAHALDLAELADALAAWMKVAGVGRAVLLGNSLGCQTIIHFALRHPALIARAVLVGATIDPRARSFFRQVGRGLNDLRWEPCSLWPILITDYLKAGLMRGARTLAYALRDNVREHLPRVRVPTLVVRGANDPICPQAWGEEMVRLLPHGTLAVLPAAAHAANFSAPEQLAAVVREFLRKEQKSR